MQQLAFPLLAAAAYRQAAARPLCKNAITAYSRTGATNNLYPAAAAQTLVPSMHCFAPLKQIVASRASATEQFLPACPAVAHRAQVITGPNFSGKSCYIKQVGIIVLLAHIGSFVPAEEAIVGVTDRIFTRIISVDAHAIPQSTFMTDLCQVSAMLRNATSQCAANTCLLRALAACAGVCRLVEG